MLPISVCIIARNEERHIEECLKALKPYHCEIVLVDTGSTDNTLTLAAGYTDQIYHFDWCDDFSAAKNYAVSKASNDWILSIDCDEYLESIDIKKLSALMERHPQKPAASCCATASGRTGWSALNTCGSAAFSTGTAIILRGKSMSR